MASKGQPFVSRSFWQVSSEARNFPVQQFPGGCFLARAGEGSEGGDQLGGAAERVGLGRDLHPEARVAQDGHTRRGNWAKSRLGRVTFGILWNFICRSLGSFCYVGCSRAILNPSLG